MAEQVPVKHKAVGSTPTLAATARWQRIYAPACKAGHVGENPTRASICGYSAAVAQHVANVQVVGSIPTSRSTTTVSSLAMPYRNPDERRQYQREWVARRRAEWFAGKTCWRCGSTDDLQIDHRDPRDKVTNAIWSWATPRRDAELAKCQVLCKPCHQWKTTGCEEHVLRGQHNGRARLTEAMVIEARRLHADGEAFRSLAQRYGVALATMKEAITGTTWKHLP